MRAIVPCPLIISAASLNTLIILDDFLKLFVKHTKTFVFVRKSFLKSLISAILSMTAFLVFVFARYNGTSNIKN